MKTAIADRQAPALGGTIQTFNEDTKKAKAYMSEAMQKADQLIEGWSKRASIREGLIEMASQNLDKARSTAIMLENNELHFNQLDEAVVSTAFRTTPENAFRVIQLGFGQANRGDIFHDFAMQTPKDTAFYIDPTYTASVRGATSGKRMYEDPAFRYASATEYATVATGANNALTYTLAGGTVLVPVRPGSVKISATISGGQPEIIAVDDRNGNLIQVDTTSPQYTLSGTNTISYSTGAITVTFTANVATGTVIKAEYNFSAEDSAQFTQIQEMGLALRAYPFELREFPLYVVVSNMTKMLLSGSLSVDAQEAIVRNAGGELAKSLDFYAVDLAMKYARGNGTPIAYNFTGATGESEIDRAQSATRYIGQAANLMYNALQRGSVAKIIAGPNAAELLKLHARFTNAGEQSAINLFRMGSIDGIDIYKVPSTMVPTNELLCIYKNPDEPQDVALAIGTYVPLYISDPLTFKNMQTEQGVAWYGDMKVVQPKYLQRVVISNIPT